jgi:hypothetical protein
VSEVLGEEWERKTGEKLEAKLYKGELRKRRPSQPEGSQQGCGCAVLQQSISNI